MFLKKKKEEKATIDKNIIDYCNKLLELEKDRENILIKNSNTMIIYNSILLIPLITIMFELYNRLETIRLFTIIFGMTLIVITLLSILFSILSEHIYKIESNKSLLDFLDNGEDKDSFIEQYISELNYVHETKEKNNEKRRSLLLVSHILNYTFYGLIIIFGMVMMILM